MVSFNDLATAPCNWQVNQNLAPAGTTLASWLANEIHGHGVVFQDRGQTGVSVLNPVEREANAVFAKYPGIKRYYYTSNVTPSLESSGVSSLFAAHPDVKGIFALGFGQFAIEALTKAGHKPVPTTGWSVNGTLEDCVKYTVPCADIGGPTWFGGLALADAINIRDGKYGSTPKVLYNMPVTFMDNTPGLKFTDTLAPPILSIKDNVLVGKNANISLPLSPTWQKFTPKELGL
jgi:hypothetical protein